MAAVGADAFLDLHGELPGGNQDQDADPATAVRARDGVEALEDGQHEGGRLAGARLGAGQQVTPREDMRNGLALDGGRLGVAGVRDSAEQVGRQPEVSKGHGSETPDEALPREAGPGQGMGESGISGKGPGRRPRRPWKPGGVPTLSHDPGGGPARPLLPSVESPHARASRSHRSRPRRVGVRPARSPIGPSWPSSRSRSCSSWSAPS